MLSGMLLRIMFIFILTGLWIVMRLMQLLITGAGVPMNWLWVPVRIMLPIDFYWVEWTRFAAWLTGTATSPVFTFDVARQ